MQNYQRHFLQFAIAHQVLRFGNFTLKSGRRSPYFFNTGLFQTGKALAELGRYYAQAIQAAGIEFNTLFGPAYKGIPLVVTTAIALADQHQRDVPYCFNRKETKDHGEGGQLIGAPLTGKILLIDDVISAGTAIRESIHLINQHDAQLIGVVISLNRQERGQAALSAIEEIEQNYGIKVTSIVSLADLIAYLQEQPESSEILPTIQQYRAQYGI